MPELQSITLLEQTVPYPPLMFNLFKLSCLTERKEAHVALLFFQSLCYF